MSSRDAFHKLLIVSVALFFGFRPEFIYSMSSLAPVNTSERQFVPEWAKSAVWYQIFPERFRNGDAGNDPAKEELAGSWPHFVPSDWQTSDWSGDWYELQPWERNDNRGFYVHVQNRRYGGDLQGVLEKLDYLKELGITAIYFNPLFESPSLHKYDAASYHHIDNNFGPHPAGDRQAWMQENPADPSTWTWTSADRLFLKLIEEAHKRGMRIVVDGVFNHVGLRYWAFEDVKRRQQQSSYKDWFIVNRWDDPATPEDEFDYEGWMGVRELPEIREDENGPPESFADHVHAVVRRWMDPNGDGDPSDGIDGWRLDVAEKVSIRFWEKFRTWVREINPEAYLVGEVWWEDWKNDKMFNAAPWLQGEVFDAVMNYRWAREAFLFFAGEKTRITAIEFARRLQGLLTDYPAQVNYVLMNLYDSHDTDRIGSRLLNPDFPYDHFASPVDNTAYDVRKPGLNQQKIQKLMVLFQMTYLGAPVIYYGSEAGMWGADDPDCRKPMVWEGMVFSPETKHPFGANRPNDENTFNRELFDWYRTTIAYRHAHPSLQKGEMSFLKTSDDRNVLAYYRHAGSDAVMIVLNNALERQEIRVDVTAELASKNWVPGLGSADFRFDDAMLVTLEARSGIAIHSN
ncbi:MAG: glycoside hydrolase family 13 protein [Ignavibacteriales bacterium]|nr:glycoside hydrolase family 13 protein [Ignavibacteriales bacterium]